MKWRLAGGPKITRLKLRLAGVPMMARFQWHLDPLTPHQIKKKHFRVGTPLTILSGSAHEFAADEIFPRL